MTDKMTNNIGRKLIPFGIHNFSGSHTAYLYMFGTTDAKNPKKNTYFLSDFNGDCTLFPPNQKHHPYGLPLSIHTVTNAKFLQLDAVRVYISLEKQLLIDTNEDGIPGAVSADNPAPGQTI